jgi:hypothetical protein
VAAVQRSGLVLRHRALNDPGEGASSCAAWRSLKFWKSCQKTRPLA